VISRPPNMFDFRRLGKAKLLRDEEGQDVIEYGLAAAFISIVLVTILFEFSDPINTLYAVVLDALKLVPK
jgi:Flp pilus assembly pilin Flp